MLSGFCRESTAIVWLIFDGDERVISGNVGARQLFGADPAGKTPSEIFVDFGGSFSIADLARQDNRPVNLHIQTSACQPETIVCRVFRIGDQFHLFGHLDHQELLAVRDQFRVLTSESCTISRELAKKNAELSKLNESKSRFLGMAAHDLRNPIGIIRSYGEFLLNQTSDETPVGTVEFLNEIISMCDFMLSLLNDLLDITKIEAGKVRLKKQDVDLIALVARNLVLNQRLADKKQIQLKFFHREPVPRLFVDPLRIDQILNNLLSNAIKFSPAETTVTVEVFRSVTHVTLSVKDEGPGIPEDEIPRLFQPFPQISVQSTNDEPSTGLGLAITRRLVMAHLGQIHVESQEGRGTAFYVSFPIDSDDENGDSPARKEQFPHDA